MAVVTQTPQNPEIAASVSDVPGPQTPANFRSDFNARKTSLDTKAKRVEAFLEQLQAAIGNGALSGGTISAGTGLAVNITAGKALVGSAVEWDATAPVGGLAPSASGSGTNRLWLRQDGTWSVTQSGTAPSGDGHGYALLWGTADTNTSGVTAVSNVRRTFAQLLSRAPVAAADPAEAADGDMWYRSDTNQLCVRVAGVVKRSGAFT